MRKQNRLKRAHLRVRKKVQGSADRPRLAVFKSGKHIYAQVIDDRSQRTLVAASSLDKRLKLKHGGNREAAAQVGELLAKASTDAGITQVVFDRGGHPYHGRIEQLASAAREGGLEF